MSRKTSRNDVSEVPAVLTEGVSVPLLEDSLNAESAATETSNSETVEFVAEAPAEPIAFEVVTLSPRAIEYLQMLLGQYIGPASVDAYVKALEGGRQLVVRSAPMRVDVSDEPFVRLDLTCDISDAAVLLHVNRQLANVRLLDE